MIKRLMSAVFILLTVACVGRGAATSEETIDRSAAAPEEERAMEVRFALSVVGDAPTAGAPVTFAIEAVNEGADAVTLNFANGQRYDLEILGEDGSTVWRWAQDMMFTMMLGQETLDAGGSVRWEETYADGLAAGTYRVVATLTASDPMTAELELVVSD